MIGVFIVAGVLAALTSLMTAGEAVAVTANEGNHLIFQVFVAAVLRFAACNRVYYASDYCRA